MLRLVWNAVLLLFVFLSTISVGYASTIELTSADGFVAEEPDVMVSGGVVTFAETIDWPAIYFYNDNFVVDDNATILSFKYDLVFGADDYDDYLLFEIDNYDAVYDDFEFNETAVNPGGYFEYDVSGLRGQTISIAWSLQAGDFDFQAGTIAHVYDIDVATAAVPEPSTEILLMLGLLAAAGIRRTQIHS